MAKSNVCIRRADGSADDARAQRKLPFVTPFVFHRKGERIASFGKAWKRRAKQRRCPAGYSTTSAARPLRNVVRRRIPERVVMTISGHKTRSVSERYNIVSERDWREAAAKMNTAST